MVFGISMPHYKVMIGSYLLLYKPSIGYVWIMRVFLLMALILPLIYKIIRRINVYWCCVIIAAIIALQSVLTSLVNEISNESIKYILTETLLYAIGYSAIAILGLKIKEFNVKSFIALSLVSVAAILGFMEVSGMPFDPSRYKYPPQSLYLIYGVLGCTVMMSAKPCFIHIAGWRGFKYLSENSMWIYLWHIVSVMFIIKYADVPGMWFGRYIIVLFSAIAMNQLWQRITLPLHWGIKKYMA